MGIIRNAFAAALALSVSLAASAAGTPMLEISAQARPSPRDVVFAALAQDPASARIRRVDVRAALLSSDTRSLLMDLGDFQVNVDRASSDDTASGNLVWQGQVREARRLRLPGAREIATDPANFVTLVRHGDQVTGNLRVHGQLYQLRPLGKAGHVLVEVNEAMLPPEHPHEYAAIAAASAARSQEATASIVPVRYVQPVVGYGMTVITVMVVATQSAAQVSSGIGALIDLAIAESNQGFINSGIAIRLQLAGLFVADYVESGSFSTDLSRFRGTGDGYMDSFHATRDRIAADVNMLVINDSDSCGLASAIGASAETAFAVVHWNCATGIYSFAHEIGHLLAARHDPASDAASTPHAYGHGYRYTPASGEGWRTVMALDCPSSCTRLNFWSNANHSYDGVPIGNALSSDNARVLMQRRTAMAGFRRAPGEAAIPLD